MKYPEAFLPSYFTNIIYGLIYVKYEIKIMGIPVVVYPLFITSFVAYR